LIFTIHMHNSGNLICLFSHLFENEKKSLFICLKIGIP
jgi:hypothetical protein